MDWKRYGMGGGWLDQPLSLLAQTKMIDTVSNTYKYKTTDGADWTKFTPEQTGIIRWLENG